ncbi:MAG: right-handed parallel beta-helix repeat-containing protein [Ginsengibacter sp.]
MKILLALLFIGFFSTAFSKSYYFSSSSGDDSRSADYAQKSSTPWKSLSKLNSIFSILEGGDSVLLKRGDIFYGSIIATKSGVPNVPIVIASYGSGSLPVVSGFVKISQWTSNGNGIFKATQSLDDSILNMVLINNSEYAMGQFPNADASGGGWLSIASHIGNSSITSSASIPNASWSNSEIVIRKKRYVIDRNKILSQDGNTLNYKSGTQYEPFDKFGFFLQNNIATLDQFGEWYFDPNSKKLNVFFGNKLPQNFKVSASNLDVLLSLRKQENISVFDIAFEGSDKKAIDLYYAKNIALKKCSINFSGGNAIDGYFTQNLIVENCNINNSNNNAFDLTGDCNGLEISNNIIGKSGMYAGMAGNSPHSFSGINVNGNNIKVENNRVDSTGYAAIRFAGNSVSVTNNFVNYFCMVKDDGGGIYTGNNDANNPKTNQVIANNIILNGVGVSDGTSEKNMQAHGIYLDDNSANINVSGNSVAYCNKAGIYLHNCHDVTVTGNVVFGNGTQLIMQKDAASKGLVRNNIIQNNTFFSQKRTQLVASYLTSGDDINLFGNIDNNYYGRPIDDNITISISYTNAGQGKMTKYMNLNGWKSQYKKDDKSVKSKVELPAYKVKGLVSSNKISNGNFNSDISGVHGFRSKVTWQNPGFANDGCLQVTSSQEAATSYITIPAGSIISGKDYILRFGIKGADNSGKTVGIYLRQNGAPYTSLSSQTSYKSISYKPQSCEIAFTATANDDNALLVFALTDPATTYWLDNIQLYEANAQITKPEDHVLFEYNAGNIAKTIALSGTYTDPGNKTYSKQVTLQPFTSIILVKQD